MVEEESNEIEDKSLSGENPEEVPEGKQKELLEKQKQFEYEEVHSAEANEKAEKKSEKMNTFYRWLIAFFAAIGIGFLAWYLLF
jgi:hypothetical protein